MLSLLTDLTDCYVAKNTSVKQFLQWTGGQLARQLSGIEQISKLLGVEWQGQELLCYVAVHLRLHHSSFVLEGFRMPG
jgi:hypothetical protein